MSTFQLIIITLAIVYVLSFLYFSISGRILNQKQAEKDEERFQAQTQIDDQIKVLTNRLGEIATENDRLNGVIRSWVAQANDYKRQLDEALKEKEEWQKEAEKLAQPVAPKKRNSKKGGE